MTAIMSLLSKSIKLYIATALILCPFFNASHKRKLGNDEKYSYMEEFLFPYNV